MSLFIKPEVTLCALVWSNNVPKDIPYNNPVYARIDKNI